MTLVARNMDDVKDKGRCCPNWLSMPDVLMLKAFSYLDASSLCQASLVCKSWLGLAFDELLWKDLFHCHWKISRSVPLAPGKQSWVEEYKRLLYHVPTVEIEVVKKHTDEVLHVSFSNNGKMFATTSKDGFVMVWDSYSPATPKFEADMKDHNFFYTQFTQFNPSDRLLLVSGPDLGFGSYTSGEIAVFNLEGEFTILFRRALDPFALFGWWLNDSLFFIGNLHNTGYLKSISELCLCQASGDSTSCPETTTTVCRFANINDSSVRHMIMANCVNQLENTSTDTAPKETEDQTLCNKLEAGKSSKETCQKKHVVREMDGSALSDHLNGSEHAHTCPCICSGKILIFTKGSLTHTPHQIGIKKFKSLACTCVCDNDNLSTVGGGDSFSQHKNECDEIDYLFDMEGHIVGMRLSPDHRYLYVNNRPWPKNYKIDDPQTEPSISEEMQIHVIDLLTMQIMGVKHKGHLAYTQGEDCFFMFLDVSDDYVVSGAENKQGYLWDRHYGICLQKYPHNDVVNAVTFNPKDPEMLVSVSDDWSIKIWRSLNRQKEYKNSEASFKSLSAD